MPVRQAESSDADEHIDSHSDDGVPPHMTMHPSIGYSGMPMHMYPFAGAMVPTPQQLRSKRRQVKNACTNCQKACKKCDDARPCLRCVKYGIAEECIDSQRRERKKGVKRGPYKKRDGKDLDRADNSPDQESPPAPQTVAIPATTPSASPPIGAYMTPAVGFPPGFYSQYAPPGRPGEAPAYFPQFYITQVPPQPTGDGEAPVYPPHTQFYPAFVPYPQPYPPYMVPHQRADGQMTMAPYPMYKPPSTGSSSEPGTSSKGTRAHAKSAREQEEEEEEEEEEEAGA